ncbi:MAG: uroporphyrinogen-III synthase, partial [Rhodobacteraceae bacterium]|nr:uroporphyrinogen-III synthase [Paracoccaceae bacterium]
MPPLVLATRPQPAADALVVRLKGLVYQALAAPTLEIERLSHLSLRDLTESAALALTSAAGARAVEQDLGRNAISGLHMPVFCVGAATAMAAKAAGFGDVISADGDGEALEAEIVAARPRGPVMHLRGEDLAHDLAAGLRAQGVAA